jgi:hypothetical protein
MPGRDNGLPARSSWKQLADLEPQLADRAVEVLGDAGVPAYAQASTDGPIGAITQPLASRPNDRVFVDAEELERAREVLRLHLPALRAELDARAAAERSDPGRHGELRPGFDVDAEWAAIVAGYDTPAAPVGPWPADEDLETDEPPADPRTRVLRPAQDPGRAQPAVPAEPPEPPGPPAEDPQDHYIPPPPPPLPHADPITRWAWGGLIGGPVYLIGAWAVEGTLGGWSALLGVGAFIGGFATLVARMKDRPPQDDGPDDGAVV